MTADERIEQLLKRAGCPMMVVHTTEPTKVSLPVDELVDTIDRLEAALENALNERDALHADFEEYVKRVIGGTGSICACTMCKHYCSPDSPDFFKRECPARCESFNHWEWRGVPDKEDANE